MSLYGSIQMANSTLQAQQIGLAVVAQNIANANTPGYTRSEAVFKTAPTQRVGDILLGLGARVDGIVQQADDFLDQRLRAASGDRASLDAQVNVYTQLENTLGALGDSGLGTSLANFFNSINDVLNQPESASVRNLATLRGASLANDLNQLGNRVQQLRVDVNKQINQDVDRANKLIDQIADLNVKIASFEGGELSHSDAVGLRDQRNNALAELSEILGVRTQEVPETGAANIFLGGDYLVFEGQTRHLQTVSIQEDGVILSRVNVRETGGEAQLTSGRLSGLIVARDDILGGFQDDLDNFARTLVFEFNKAFSSGQGLSGYQQLASEFTVNSLTAPLDATGLTYTPASGQFNVQIYNTQTGSTQTTTIPIDLNGLDNNDTTLESLRSALDAVDGLSASITSTGQLVLTSESSNLQFAFGDDSSGVLAALGLNTFFTGTRAGDIGVRQEILSSPGRFAASRSGIGGDTANAAALASLFDQPLASLNGNSLTGQYQGLTAELAQNAAAASAVADGFKSFEETLNSQRLAVSGVSLDEEAVKLISYQRAYQAAAKFISVLNELLDQLVSL